MSLFFRITVQSAAPQPNSLEILPAAVTPECTTHDECSNNKACSNLKCIDSCIGACGTGAECRVEKHQAICSCPAGTTGHPFDRCRPLQFIILKQNRRSQQYPYERYTFVDDLCNPNPCGQDADCKPGKDESGNDRSVCFCRSGFLGDPLVSCRRGQCIDHAVLNYNPYS